MRRNHIVLFTLLCQFSALLLSQPAFSASAEDDFFSDAFETEVLDDGFALPEVNDPYEGFNRKVFAFNETLDRWAFKPMARGYQAVTPRFADDSVSHFFDNVGEVKTIVNDLLQANFRQAGRDTSRFLINTTFGFFGFFDVASKFGLTRHKEDFGQTFAVWGVGQGPYLMLPFMGPSTLRDAGGLSVQWSMSTTRYLIEEEPAQYGLFALDVLDTRADLIQVESLVFGDRYTFLRDAYLQRREHLISNGNRDDED